MSSLLLATKLHIPPPRPDLVRRPRLTERLDEGLRLGHRLMLISASAGYGKTTLVTEWLHSMDRPFAWLTLEDDDNDPARFLSYLVAALRSVDPGVGHSVQPLLEAFEPGRANSILTALINDVAEARHSFVVALDDYHVIHTLPIHQQLAFLVDHLPQQMHLVIATREDPPLPLSRLRARRQMTEIRQADLRFTSEEAAMLLNQIMGLKLTPTDITALESRTEGWIAGLQLAALSMCQRSDPHAFLQSFTGSTRYVLDYLMDEVFRRQPEEVQDFLVQTSVLDRLSTPLCDAVTGREDSQRMLLTLEQANLFIVPLDEGRQWYRYHRLFADLLRHRLGTRRSVDDAATLHGRASQWHEANGFPAEAVRHALAAADWERAATLICDLSSAMFKRGELVTLLKWMRALPDEHVRARPDLCINYSWALILTGQLEAAESYLGEAERVAQDEHALLGDIISAQAYIARAQGDDRRTIELSQRALSLLPSDALNERCVVAVNLGIAHWTSGNLPESECALTVAEDAAEQSGNVYARWTAHSFRAVLQAAWGRLRQAAELLRQAIRSGEQSPAIALAYNELSALLYEWNDLEAAVEQLQQGIELGKRSGNVEVQIGGYRTLARVKQAQGDSAVALSALQKAHQLARDSDVPPLMRARNAACHFQIALAQDDMAIATHWAEQVTEDADA
jgi:LuxR family maltose regulon positive regulatory protein